MAGRPIVIEFAARTRDFLRGSRDVQASTEDIADELRDATRDADKFEASFTASMKDAERAADRAARNMGRDFKRVEDDLGEVGREAGQEFKQNLGESLASGDLSGVVQDTLGGLVSSLKGPIGGAAVVAAGAAAIAFGQVREDWERMMTALSGSFDNLMSQMQETNRFYQSAGELQQVLNQSVRENAEEWRPVMEAAETLGMTVQEIGLAILQGGDATKDLETKLKRVRDEGTTVSGNAANVAVSSSDSAKAAEVLLRHLRAGGGELADLKADWQTIASAAGVSARAAERQAAALRNARDYAAGLGGRVQGSRNPYQNEPI